MTRTAQIARANCTEWISLHALVAFCLVLGVVQYAESQALQKWKTPNGTIYFGHQLAAPCSGSQATLHPRLKPRRNRATLATTIRAAALWSAPTTSKR